MIIEGAAEARTKKERWRKRTGRLMLYFGCLSAFYFTTVMLRGSFDFGLCFLLLVSLGAAGWGWLKLMRPAPALTGKARWLKHAVYLLLLVWLLSFVAVEAMIYRSSNTHEPSDADYLLVLGAGLWGDQMPRLLSDRVETARLYLLAHPSARVIVSGGQGRGETITEAEAMKRYLVRNGIPESRIIKEERSTSTFENLKNTREILAQNQAGSARIAIVSSDYHIFRSLMLARRLGMNAGGIPCPTYILDVPHSYAREYLAVIKSFLLDKEA
ncbi:MAG: YdcF family protein [Firmicutes bacterium]|nr:YdcF family protein [Bacillota bacterium]